MSEYGVECNFHPVYEYSSSTGFMDLMIKPAAFVGMEAWPPILGVEDGKDFVSKITGYTLENDFVQGRIKKVEITTFRWKV